MRRDVNVNIYNSMKCHTRGTNSAPREGKRGDDEASTAVF